MPFAKIPDKTFNTDFKRAEFLDLAQGSNIIRILDDEAYSTIIHYVKGAYVECLGEDCPVCKNNKRIISENPKDFRNIPGYASRSDRFITNVLDRTPAKKCPTCGKYTKKAGNVYPTACTCGAVLVNVQEAPIEKVKILAKGRDLFSQFIVLEESVLTKEKEPLGLKNFDINLVVKGTGRDTEITAVPLATSTDEVKVADEDKFDVTKVSLHLGEGEILELMKGVAIRDILLSRSASLPKDPNVPLSDVELQDDVKSRLDELLA